MKIGRAFADRQKALLHIPAIKNYACGLDLVTKGAERDEAKISQKFVGLAAINGQTKRSDRKFAGMTKRNQGLHQVLPNVPAIKFTVKLDFLSIC